MSAELKTGSPCPRFSLKDQEGNIHKPEDYRGGWLLVYFYPKALTPGCTTQSCSVRDAREDLASLGCRVLGISPDEEKLQKKFDEKHGLGFPLLSDPDHAAAEGFGVWGEKKMYGKSYMGIIRSSFLVDPEGKIREAWYKVSPGDTVPLARKALEKAAG